MLQWLWRLHSHIWPQNTIIYINTVSQKQKKQSAERADNSPWIMGYFASEK